MLQRKQRCDLFLGKNAKLSNFHPCEFTEKNLHFTSVEQFFCYQKADFFEDPVAKEKILNTSDPKTIKQITIKGFNKGDWGLVATKVMERGLELKFGQNYELKEFLLSTKRKKLVEASPTDRFWGIGYAMTSPDLENTEKWGQNKLGELLMIQRDKMRE